MRISRVPVAGCLGAYLLCVFAISGERAVAGGAVTILVNKGPFASVEEAATGEEKVAWWDDFEAHPEWYGLRRGKRSAKIDEAGDNYCTSNPDATRELAQNLVRSLSDGAWRNVDIVNFWMMDNGKWCECDVCARQGPYTDRLFDVCYAVQKAIQKAQREGRLHRKVLLASLAYHEILAPPSRRLPADFRTFYPTTSHHAREFYRHLEQATANFKPFKHYAGKDFYSLRRRLTVDSLELFPLKHLHYDAYHPETDDGQDVVEIVDGMRVARKELDAALLECRDKAEAARLLEDDLRFAYGEAMVSFYYHLVRTTLLHRRGEAMLARREFGRVEHYADRLRSVTDLVRVPSA
jgi:hypothetical protein